MYNREIAAIGPKDTVTAFKTLGIPVAAVSSGEEAGRAVDRFTEEGYKVILVTEAEAEGIRELIERHRAQMYPLILPIPGAYGGTGLGMRRVRENVEKAMGTRVTASRQSRRRLRRERDRMNEMYRDPREV